MNKIILMGRLTRDVDFKTTASGGFARFTVAVDRPKTKDQQVATDFINCVAWGKTGENISKFFEKGNKILVEGSLRIGSYENKDGVKIPTADVSVLGFDFVESKTKTSDKSSGSLDSMGTSVPFDVDVPF